MTSRVEIFTAGLMAILSFFLLSCEKTGEGDGTVELYLIESYETVGQRCEINTSSVVIKETPLIIYDDFLSYNADTHTFLITDEAEAAVKNQQHSVDGLPFALTADREIIYTGYFWPAYSSLICDWVVIDPLMIFGDNQLRVRLGYPGPIEGVEIPDRRNDRRILNIFRHDGKLIE